MHVFVASHNGSEGDRGRIGRGRTQVPRFPFPSHKEHTQPPLKVGSLRCDTAAAVAAASWRGGPFAGSILARLHLPVELNSAPRDIRNTRHAHTKPGRANTTAYRRRRRRRAPKHRWPCSPPGQPRGAVGGWAPASNLPAPCWPHRDKGTKISNCKSVVMVFTVSVGFAMDGILMSLKVENAVCVTVVAPSQIFLHKTMRFFTPKKQDEGGLSSRAQSRRAPRRTCTRAEVGTVVVVGGALRTAQRASPLLFPETRDRQRGRERECNLGKKNGKR